MSVSFSVNSYRTVWHLAWPIILSNLSVPLLGAVDTAVIGHLPDPAYLGAVGIGAMIFSFLYWGFGFLKMGTTGFVAQAAGAEDTTRIRTILAQSFILSICISLAILCLQYPVRELALYLIDPTDAVASGTTEYFNHRIWGAPAALMNYALLGFFVGLGRMRTALVLQVVMNGANILLDLFFVIGLDMKVPGVALATTLSEYLAVFLGLTFAWRELTRMGGEWLRKDILSLGQMGRLMSVNFNIFIRTILLIVSFSYFTVSAARLGDEVLAAVTVAMNFVYFLSFGLDGFAHAASTLVGKAVGAKDQKGVDQAVWVSSSMALIVAVLYMFLYAVLGDRIINLLTTIESVRLLAYEFVPWLVAMPLIAVWSYQFDGIFVGAMKSSEMRNGMILSFAAYFLAIKGLGEPFGADGLWAALCVFMVMRGLTLAFVYP
ncbi:MAG: MATE family efflux transporter, partial [Sneathiella sp.]